MALYDPKSFLGSNSTTKSVRDVDPKGRIDPEAVECAAAGLRAADAPWNHGVQTGYHALPKGFRRWVGADSTTWAYLRRN